MNSFYYFPSYQYNIELEASYILQENEFAHRDIDNVDF